MVFPKYIKIPNAKSNAAVRKKTIAEINIAPIVTSKSYNIAGNKCAL